MVPTPFPTREVPTPTPRSTALPEVSPAPRPGEGERTIVILFALPDKAITSNVRRAAIQLQRQLELALQLDFSVEFVDEQTALDTLCSGAPRAAWISPFGYAHAQARCAVTPVRAVQRGRPPRITIGRTADVVARREITDLSQMAGQTFCRSRQQDLFTAWVLPGLALSAAGVNPFTDLAAVLDYPDDETLALALVKGQCAAAGLPADRLDDLLDRLAPDLSTAEAPVTADDLAALVGVLIPAGDVSDPTGRATWNGFARNTVPYEVLVFAPESALSSPLRTAILDEIDDFFNDRSAGSERLQALLDASAIMPVEARHYTTFRALVTDSGWDMTFTH